MEAVEAAAGLICLPPGLSDAGDSQLPGRGVAGRPGRPRLLIPLGGLQSAAKRWLKLTCGNLARVIMKTPTCTVREGLKIESRCHPLYNPPPTSLQPPSEAGMQAPVLLRNRRLVWPRPLFLEALRPPVGTGSGGRVHH